MPITMPIANAEAKRARKFGAWVNSSMMRPTIRPVEMPLCTPWPITVPQVRRPSTRSTERRSVPTMARFCTGNCASAR